MHETGRKLLELMFQKGESVCVSPNKYGYHSIDLEGAFQEPVRLVSTKFRDDNKSVEEATEEHPGHDIKLVALNPIQGWREDGNCKAFRNFLIELDVGPLNQQRDYIHRLGMPYSAIVFSGSKSLHFLISLDEDLPSEKVWRHLAQWILNIATNSDQNCKNPSRSIRIPGAVRDDKKQLLVEFKGKVPLQELIDWLKKHPNAMPVPKEKKPFTGTIDFSRIRPWVVKALTMDGLDPSKGRNKQWFAIAYDFALAGYDEDTAIDFLEQYFDEDRTFKEREWLSAIRSAYKTVYQR